MGDAPQTHGNVNGEFAEESEIEDLGGVSFGVIGFARNTETAVTLYGAGLVGAGNDLTVTANGALVVGAGNDLRFCGTAGMVAAGSDVTLQDARIGVLIAGADINAADVHVLMRTPQAAVFGAAFGAALALLTWLLRRR